MTSPAFDLDTLNRLTPTDFHFHVAYFDVEQRAWRLPEGEFNVYYPLQEQADEAAKADAKSGMGMLSPAKQLKVTRSTVRVVRCRRTDCR